ncbi:DUF819 family protein [Roseofilum reptotaenium CS-1145]|uniref:DUF819 family protein n=1 Tax=Roseofilum reptotaenium AO1-A TaxID=1925591 RepID=A0A1L9QS92_9CYAN|nr:DUF819 family protein [Roseofilum reptotaenium]MDB9518264.1 DUF819 family protein [Roseofilum reptotaenium CS-1145]OJJ25531.1 hypothetical protein BI308_11235 [Roseofilum reptotaenium AO1-A]
MIDPFILPNSNLILGAILLALCAVGYWAEQTRRGTPPLAALLVLCLASLCSHLGVTPTSAPIYTVIATYGITLAIPLILSQINLRELATHAKATLLVFACGMGGTILGSILGLILLPLGDERGKLAAIFVAQYIGNSLNAADVASALDFQGSIPLETINTIDRLIASLFILFWLLISIIPGIRRFFSPHQEDWGIRFGSAPVPTILKQTAPTRFDLALALAASGMSALLGYAIAAFIRLPGSELFFTAIIVIILTQVFSTTSDRLAGIEEFGALAILLFFSTLGATTSIPELLALNPILLQFAGIILLTHLAIILLAGKLLNIEWADILIASNASIGSATLGVAMAVAQRWETLIIPAIICGTVGSVLANPISLILGHLLS